MSGPSYALAGACRTGCRRSVFKDDSTLCKEWQSEDEIKAELRELTEATRKLRHDLDSMVRHPARRAERRDLHKTDGQRADERPQVDRRKRGKSPE
ncbi:MAG TPA: hypothetical protein VGI12_05070 [Vicinamibacterales bacterium]|jgi:hypothetical protein